MKEHETLGLSEARKDMMSELLNRYCSTLQPLSNEDLGKMIENDVVHYREMFCKN